MARTLKLETSHATSWSGAFLLRRAFQGELIGFIKLILHGESASIMQIIRWYHNGTIAEQCVWRRPWSFARSGESAGCSIGHLDREPWASSRTSCLERIELPALFRAAEFKGQIALGSGCTAMCAS